MMNKQEIEQKIISVIQLSIIPLTPIEIRKILEKRGLTRDEIGSAVARLADKGKICIDSNMKVGLNYDQLR